MIATKLNIDGYKNMELEIKFKNVYGNDLIYPNCDKSRLICQIMETKTIPNDKLELLKELGYKFNIGVFKI
jgi:hypothetical protein